MTIERNPILLDAVAKALFDNALERARIEMGKFNFDMSDAIPVFKKLVTETDTGIAIVTAAYFDECLKNLFFLHINNSSRKIIDRVFDFNGALGTFSSRIDLAYGFNLVTKETHQSLNSIRRIRNDFAHKPFSLSFNSGTTKDKIIGIDINHKRFIDEIRKTKELRKITKPPSRLTMKEIFLIKSALSLSDMASEMIVLPIAKQNNIPARAILGNYDNLPENLKNIRRNSSRCILNVFAVKKK